MSYVENQGVYAVNCASLDEVRTSHHKVNQIKPNPDAQAEKKGDKTPWASAAQIHDMKTRRVQATSPHGSISQEEVRVRKVRKQCRKEKNHHLQVCKPSGAWDRDAWWAGRPIQPGCHGEFAQVHFSRAFF